MFHCRCVLGQAAKRSELRGAFPAAQRPGDQKAAASPTMEPKTEVRSGSDVAPSSVRLWTDSQIGQERCETAKKPDARRSPKPIDVSKQKKYL